MNCTKCRSEWQSPIPQQKCPFCGATLRFASENHLQQPNLIRQAVKKIRLCSELLGEPYVIYEPDKIKAAFDDFAPRHPNERQLFHTLVDSGYLFKIRSCFADPDFKHRNRIMMTAYQVLTSDYSLSSESAKYVIHECYTGLSESIKEKPAKSPSEKYCHLLLEEREQLIAVLTEISEMKWSI